MILAVVVFVTIRFGLAVMVLVLVGVTVIAMMVLVLARMPVVAVVVFVLVRVTVVAMVMLVFAGVTIVAVVMIVERFVVSRVGRRKDGTGDGQEATGHDRGQVSCNNRDGVLHRLFLRRDHRHRREISGKYAPADSEIPTRRLAPFAGYPAAGPGMAP